LLWISTYSRPGQLLRSRVPREGQDPCSITFQQL
jgi:hypothetical protein